MMNKLYLGDSEFSAKMMKIYAWVIPVVFILMTCLFLIAGAWLSSLCFLGVALLVMPPFKAWFKKVKLNGLLKFILGIVLILLGIYSTGIYL